ncbi:tail fiber protein [Synechococcus phage S-CBS4]|uniref:tail fiber protein n=1 Tax=Synechococcus phage S-CBS4 TaxID=756275 RepID=UPI000246A707|nr:tail fiber protein [Synechococcus phage S-CBS4]AEX56014.1 tail fiber protein [Synechococcus phage S-CBS4]AGN30507.1 hypothetical protein SXAG_00060 [Synechococcus phage S-CBS4]
MAQAKLISDLVALLAPGNDDLFVVVDNTTNPSQSITKKITYGDLKESLQDMVDLLISEGNGIDATYDDANNTIVLSVVPNTTTQRTIFSNSGTTVGTRQELNLIPGAGVTFASADNSGQDRVDWTINTNNVSTASGLAGSGTTYSPLSEIEVLGDGTKSINIRSVKAGSNKLSIGLTDGDEAISFDVNAANIELNDLSFNSPLAVERGGTGGSTAESARNGIGAAEAGSNTNITSIEGLTTPLSITQGGTDGNSAQDALYNLEGISYLTNVGGTGQSLIVNGKIASAGEYRAELKSLRAGSSKVTVSTVSNALTVDVNADNILNAASQNINFNGFRITNLAEPVAANDAATKGYADSVAQGLSVKDASRAATTTNFVGTYFNDTGTVSSVNVGADELTINNHPFNTGDRVYISSTGALPTGYEVATEYFVIDTGVNTLKLAANAADATSGTAIVISSTGSGTIIVSHTLYLKASGNGALSLDSVTLDQGDRVLVKDQTNATENGLYVVSETGDGSNPAVLTRSSDANASAELTAGTFVFVSEGTSNGGIAYVQITQNLILDVDDVVWAVFSASSVPANTVDNTKLADMAEATIKGRAVGGGTGDPEDLTSNQLVAILNTATATIDCGTY